MTERTLRPDVAAFLAYANAMPGPRMHEMPPEAARAQYVAMKGLVDEPVGDLAVQRPLAIPGPAGDIPAILFDARAERDPGPVVVFYHGGGWVIGNVESHASYCAELARALDLPVVSVDYRLAPEHPWPAAVDDAEAAARWVAGSPDALGLSVTGLVAAGDSAGGNLAIVTAMDLRDAPAAVPVMAQFAIYPATHLGTPYPSYHTYAEGHLLTHDSMTWFEAAYAADAAHVRASPILGTLAGMPPALVLTASHDPIRDQGRAYAAALANAGVAVSFVEVPGMIHGFITLRKVIPSGRADLDRAHAVLKAMIAAAA
ncbi:alpha/beta hydrolase [Sphingomonas sp. CJ99]